MDKKISLKKILISLIEAIDLYNFLLKDHHRRVVIIAYQIANEYGLDKELINDLVLAASIHDIGAMHVKERDQLLKVDVEDPEPHEILGEEILSEFEPFKKISKIIRHHHIKYTDIETNKYEEKIEEECFFLHLADRIDVLGLTLEESENKREKIISEINKRFSFIFHPKLKNVFNKLANTDEFWDNIENVNFNNLLFNSIQLGHYDLSKNDIEGLVTVFSRIVDFKSHWTIAHSKNVANIAYKLAHLMNFDEEICFELKISGYLHDIGKIAIPSEILDKEARLDEKEFQIMKSHATYSALILSNIDGLYRVNTWVAEHHERHDKSGYPLGHGDKYFTIEMDVLAFSDIFSALNENRPYRKSLTKNEILEILESLSSDKLDKSVLDVIKDNYDELHDLIIVSV
jgi:putative nucleotidyltransferase with HDIG domain